MDYFSVTPEDKLYWTAVGKYYGYPDCCIKEFCDFEIDTRSLNQHRVGENHYGFIPCKDHADQVINGEVKLEDLIVNRECITAFPIDDNFAEIKKKILKQLNL